MNIYVKTVSQDAAVAMKTLEANCATTVQQERLIGALEQGEPMMNMSNKLRRQSEIREF
jgi:hypothetical protein